MINLYSYTTNLEQTLPFLDLSYSPWELVERIPEIIDTLAPTEPYHSYEKIGQALVHPSAIIENGAIIKGPALISEDCFIAATVYMREGAILGPRTKVGPGGEIKSSIIAGDTALAHLNYVGNSLLGTGINLEAGVVLANHHNESPGKTVKVHLDQTVIDTEVLKFGALIGDGCKVGANSVLSPGTILKPGKIVARLALVDQSNM